MSSKVTLSLGHHHSKNVIWIDFEYDATLQKRLKLKFPRAKWSRSQQKWWIADTRENRKNLKIAPARAWAPLLPRIHANNHAALRRFVETLELKSYSTNTIKTYVNEFGALLTVLGRHHVDTLSAERLRSYFLYCINVLKLGENLIHSRLNAVKFYFEQVLGREKFFMDIPRPKKKSSLPKVMSAAEIKRLLNATENKKHLLMLQLCYGMGLRVSEVVNIKITDVDSTRMKVLIEAGKGKKDRYVNLPESLLPLLRDYYNLYQPKFFLFEGQAGAQYAIRSVQSVFKNAMKTAKINKPVGIHSLRHSYATHLLEYGTDISFIQKLLGHNNFKTTLIYTEVGDRNLANIKSPLDKL